MAAAAHGATGTLPIRTGCVSPSGSQISRMTADPTSSLPVEQSTLESQPPPSLVLLAAGTRKSGETRNAQNRCCGGHGNACPAILGSTRRSEVTPMGMGTSTGQRMAYRFLTAALAIRPRSSTEHGLLGVALKDQNKVDEAVAEFRKALRINPDYAMAHNNLGETLCDNMHDYEGAVIEFRIALHLLPANSQFHTNLGYALMNQEKFAEAEAEFREAVRITPGNANAHNGLGSTLCDGKHDYDGAITEFRTALRLKPDFAWAHFNMGEARRAQGDFTEALAEFRPGRRPFQDHSGVAARSKGRAFTMAITGRKNPWPRGSRRCSPVISRPTMPSSLSLLASFA